MPAITDIFIKRPPSAVWAVIADPSSHIHWLGAEGTTTHDGDLVEGMKFIRVEKGVTFEGEVVAVRPEQFLKVQVEPSPDQFSITEYHLIGVAEGCALRVVYETYDTGETRHVYLPEVIEQGWQNSLKRLKSYCEAN